MNIAEFKTLATDEIAVTLASFVGLCKALCDSGSCQSYWRMHACRWNYGPHLELGYGEPRSDSGD